jgi:hypothetical protein
MLNPSTTTAPAHRPRLSPDKEQLKRFINRGLNQQQIADTWAERTGNRVTRSAISMAMKSAGLKPANPRARYIDVLPWRVKVEHSKAYDARMLRAAARIEAKKKKDRLSDPEYRRFVSWKQQLKDENAVVGYTKELGFVWLERLDTDDPDDLIRRPGLPGDVYSGD